MFRSGCEAASGVGRFATRLPAAFLSVFSDCRLLHDLPQQQPTNFAASATVIWSSIMPATRVSNSWTARRRTTVTGGACFNRAYLIVQLYIPYTLAGTPSTNRARDGVLSVRMLVINAFIRRIHRVSAASIEQCERRAMRQIYSKHISTSILCFSVQAAANGLTIPKRI